MDTNIQKESTHFKEVACLLEFSFTKKIHQHQQVWVHFWLHLDVSQTSFSTILMVYSVIIFDEIKEDVEDTLKMDKAFHIKIFLKQDG